MRAAPHVLLECVEQGRPDHALDLVAEQLDRGATVTELVTGLLAPAQALVGERWHAGSYTISQEHTASATIEDALGLLAPHTPQDAVRGRVALVCAAGEWHTTPARMAALGLRDAGWKVDFLGGSTPPDHLAEALRHTRPNFLAVSATLPLSLVGVPPLVQAAHDLGIPVLAGGRAFGPDDRRARVLGADGHAPDLATADVLLSSWMDVPPQLGNPAVDDDVRAERATLATRRTAVVDGTHDELARALPAMDAHDARQRHRTRRDIDSTVQFLDAALLVDDPTLLTDYVVWLGTLLEHRGVPGQVVDRSLQVLRAMLGPDVPRARWMLDQALGA